MVKTVIITFIGMILGIIAFDIIRRKPYYSMPLYYFCNFLRRLFLPGIQVRYQIGIQIVVMVLCFMAVYTSRRKIPEYGIVKISLFENGRLFVGSVLIIACIVGWLNGNRVFQIAVDAYKVLEIYLFYYFLKFTWRTTWQIEQGVKIILLEMCLFGIVEVFTTERGSSGINILMSFFPITFACGFYKKQRFYWLSAIVSVIILFTSQTRTYMLGAGLALLIILAIANGKHSSSVRATGLLLLIMGATVGAIYMTFFENEYISLTFARIGELKEGFASSGGYRIFEMRKAIEKFLESPVFGKGYGYLEYVYIERMGWFEWGDFMHNTYVEILAKTGLYGTILYGIGLLKYIGKQYQLVLYSKKTKNDLSTGFLLGGLAGTCSWLLTYFAAPLSSYGHVFIPGIIGLLYYNESIAERVENKNAR